MSFSKRTLSHLISHYILTVSLDWKTFDNVLSRLCPHCDISLYHPQSVLFRHIPVTTNATVCFFVPVCILWRVCHSNVIYRIVQICLGCVYLSSYAVLHTDYCQPIFYRHDLSKNDTVCLLLYMNWHSICFQAIVEWHFMLRRGHTFYCHLLAFVEFCQFLPWLQVLHDIIIILILSELLPK